MHLSLRTLSCLYSGYEALPHHYLPEQYSNVIAYFFFLLISMARRK